MTSLTRNDEMTKKQGDILIGSKPFTTATSIPTLSRAEYSERLNIRTSVRGEYNRMSGLNSQMKTALN